MNAKCHACIGGTNIKEDMIKLRSKQNQIVVGTPGRVSDMIERHCLGKNLFSLTFYAPFFTAIFINIRIQ